MMIPTSTITATMIRTINHVSMVLLSLDRLVCPGHAEAKRSGRAGRAVA
jgi:hypothetical protein